LRGDEKKDWWGIKGEKLRGGIGGEKLYRKELAKDYRHALERLQEGATKRQNQGRSNLEHKRGTKERFLINSEFFMLWSWGKGGETKKPQNRA